MLWDAPFTRVLTPCSQQELASRTLDSSADLNDRVRHAELTARVSDMTRGDFLAFQSALTSLEEYLQDFCRILSLDPAVEELFSAMCMEQRKRCEVPNLLFANIVTRYDQFLNLVPVFHSHSNG